MHGYVITKAIPLESPRQSKYIPPATDITQAEIEHIQLESYGELELITQYLKTLEIEGEERAKYLRLATETELAQWVGFPVRLGRVSVGLVEKAKEHNHLDEIFPLQAQLLELKRKKPGKDHFRLAIVNGFGGNLGDNLLGATALRQVVSVIAQYLPSFAIDILFGWVTNPKGRHFIEQIPHVERFFSSGLSLAEFGRYDAYFDISNLLNYPRFFEMPTIDWYLWWMGLEPTTLPAAVKRNRIDLPYSIWEEVAQSLKGITGKRIFFNYRSSVPLRTFPEKQVIQFVQKLLKQHNDLTLIIDNPLALKHKRLIDLSAALNSVEKFQALIAQVDGMITVDSLGPHVADACATPTVLLCASLPASQYPYYPHMQGVLIPHAEKLPGWMKTKNATDKDWEEMAEQYQKAWEKLSVEKVYHALKQVMQASAEKKKEAPAQIQFQTIAPRPHFLKRTTQVNYEQFTWKYRAPSEAYLAAEKRILHIGKSLLKPGDNFIHAGTAEGHLTIELADQVKPRGYALAFEPRRLYFQTLCANALLAGLDTLYAHPVLPVETSQPISIHDTDPYSETEPARSGNSYVKTTVPGQKIDDFIPDACRLMILQPPLPIKEVLQGAIQTIQQCRPYIVFAPLPQDQAGEDCGGLTQLDYKLWADRLPVNHAGKPCLLIVAVPNEKKVDMQGYLEIEIKN